MQNTFPSVQRWLKISLLNLLLIAAIGIVLRYKIAFSLPFVDQKNLLHGHSHFAFAGWVTHTLMTLLVAYLARQKGDDVFKKYRWLIYANLFTAYGMLISFPLQGYGLASILFSTLSIFVSYFFAVVYWKDLDTLPIKNISHYWFKAGLVFSVLSSFGAFSLAYMMITKNTQQHFYLASIYAFLHFQYNGWFFFVCMGLFVDRLLQNAHLKRQRLIFWLFALSCMPAYILSVLWLKIPIWLYAIVVVATLAQLLAWIITIQTILQNIETIRQKLNATAKWILLLVSIALSIKLLLQTGSTIPALSKLAFGFRPIVIGYLHLILLGVISLFLLGYMAGEQYIIINKRTALGLKVFAIGVIVNEVVLMTQGIADIVYIPVSHVNEILLGVAITIFTGILILNISKKKLTM